MKADVRFRLRISRDAAIAVGPGKIALLEAVAATGSITAAAKSLDMSYRRAWLLIDELNRSMQRPAVDTASGGARGGGSVLTPAGEAMITLYRDIERKALDATQREIAILADMLRK